MPEPTLRVLHVFGRLLRGGAELRTVELAESFGGTRVRSDFLVLSGLDGTLDARVRAAGGDVVKCPLDMTFGPRLFRLLRERRYDVVHSHVHYFSGLILVIAQLAGVPRRIAHFRTAVVNDKRDTMLRRAQLAACRQMMDLSATDLLAVGEAAMRGAWGPCWQDDSRCRVVYSGLPSGRFEDLDVVRPFAPVMINVASLQPLKNQLRLIRVLRRGLQDLPELTLRLVGREVGDYGLLLRRAAEAEGVSNRVQFAGELEEPLPSIASSSVMVLPSLWEGLPGAALEACALGVPVLAADLPGTREIADRFPWISLLPLSASDDAWAAAAVRLIRGGPVPRSEARAAFARSPFTLPESREAHYHVWSRARASA